MTNEDDNQINEESHDQTDLKKFQRLRTAPSLNLKTEPLTLHKNTKASTF